VLSEEVDVMTGEMKYRVCPNMIPINNKIEAIEYPGRGPKEMLWEVKGRYNSKIDIKTCYPHVRVADGYQHIFGINTQHIEGLGNHFEYWGLPVGE
jgi:hypothetical protein